jgi:hypothetical protein
MRLIDTQATVARVLGTPDVAEIFLAGFRWLETQKFAAVDGWIRGEAVQPVRQSPAFKSISPHFERLLEGATSSVRPGTAILNDATYARVQTLTTRLMTEAADDSDAALCILALLVSIDERMGRQIRTEFYARAEGSPSAVPLSAGRALPKPWAAFGSGQVPFDKLAPQAGIDARRLYLEHQFGRLLAPIALAGPDGPRPALHRSGELSSGDDACREWKVAAVDVLSAFEELQIGGEGTDHFWLQSYAADGVEDRVWARLEWALNVCREGGAHLIVVPELTLSRTLVGRTAASLGQWEAADPSGLLPMVIAGRLHEPLRGEPARFRNRPAVITPDGELAWEYWKLRSFQASELGGRLEAHGSAPQYVLGIDTPLGRVAVTICLDFPDFHVQAVLRELRASVVVVPAMTPGRTVEETFHARAKALTTDSRAATVFVNSTLPIRAEILKEERQRAEGAEVRPCARTLSFVRGSTSIPAGTPLCSDEFEDTGSSATVCMYRLQASFTGGLNVRRDPPTRL